MGIRARGEAVRPSVGLHADAYPHEGGEREREMEGLKEGEGEKPREKGVLREREREGDLLFEQGDGGTKDTRGGEEGLRLCATARTPWVYCCTRRTAMSALRVAGQSRHWEV